VVVSCLIWSATVTIYQIQSTLIKGEFVVFNEGTVVDILGSLQQLQKHSAPEFTISLHQTKHWSFEPDPELYTDPELLRGS